MRRYRRRRRMRPQFVRFCILTGLALAVVLTLCVRFLQDRFGGPEGEGVAVPEYVAADFLPVNRWSRPGTELRRINGVVIHYVGNPATTAQANRTYFASLAEGQEDTFASSHFIVGLEGEVLQCVPLTEIAYASMDRNSDTVAIEVCHPDAAGKFSAMTYETVVELTAWLCGTFDLNPAEDVIRHYDVTGKKCPLYYVEHPEAWERFLQDTAAELAGKEP